MHSYPFFLFTAMKLTANPFHTTTGELLPVYRDAYLRGDLSGTSARAVEAYLHRDADQAHSTVVRWTELQHEADAAAPTWVQKQLQFVRQQPQRTRRRALTLVVGAALAAGASMAATSLPGRHLPATKLLALNTAALLLPAAEAEASANALAVVTLHGRIVNEKGQPLVGATVLRKGTSTGVSTNANGEYTLRLPARTAATLQFGYAGYADQELSTAEATQTVALQPRPAQKRRWLFF